MWLPKDGAIRIVMEAIDSKADPDVLPANEFSVDGVNWEPVPSGIEVTGFKYAIVLDEITPGQLDFNLGDFEVGIGPSRGRSAAQYLRGRVDKGCFVSSGAKGTESNIPPKIVPIGFQARLLDPYAVMLRHR